MDNPRNPSAIEVFFDGQCPLCKREIDMIRWKDKKTNRLRLVDIAAPEFDAAEYGKTLDEFHREIHGRDTAGRWLTGVDVFREIYRQIGFGPVVSLSRLPIIRSLLNLGYRGFASVRYRAAMRRIKKASRGTNGSVCETNCSPLGGGK